MTDTAYFCVLSHEGVLAVRGPDASKFLQGQLTCNLNYLDHATSSLGARCTPKGRMQSSFRILTEGNGLLLAMASELLQPQLADLGKYAVFSKSQLSDESALWCRFGLSQGDGALVGLGLELPQTADQVVRGNGLIALRLADGRAELWCKAQDAEQVRLRLGAQLAEAPLQRWLLDQIRAGVGQVFGTTRELFIPQMINLQALGGSALRKAVTPDKKSLRACNTSASSNAGCIALPRKARRANCQPQASSCSRRCTARAWARSCWRQPPEMAWNCWRWSRKTPSQTAASSSVRPMAYR